jgi:hypothetical protein
VNAAHKGAAPAAIALDMSECEVVKRASPADRIDIAVNDRGERAVTLTYADAIRPGIYRFRSGRLFFHRTAPGSGGANEAIAASGEQGRQRSREPGEPS